MNLSLTFTETAVLVWRFSICTAVQLAGRGAFMDILQLHWGFHQPRDHILEKCVVCYGFSQA